MFLVPAKAGVSFQDLWPGLNDARGWKVMITKNIAYRHGLARGICGMVIGAVYHKKGMGIMPDAIVIEVPTYCGPPLYPGEPKWVPIRGVTHMQSKSPIPRTQFPFLPAFARTSHKAQGLTVRESEVIPVNGSSQKLH